MANSRAGWNSLDDNLGDIPWEDIFKHSAPAIASEFFERLWLELMYILFS